MIINLPRESAVSVKWKRR